VTSPPIGGLQVAIVHERFTELGGSERVVSQFQMIWPEAPVFTSILDPDSFPSDLVGGVRTSWLQRLYRGGPRYAQLLPFMPLAMSRLDLGHPDVVVTSHHAFSNRVRPPAGVPLVAYVHTPARWIWEPELIAQESGGRLDRLALGTFARTQRSRDRAAATRATLVVANSRYIALRIKRYWGIDATVLNPPINVEFFTPAPDVEREDFFLLAGRLVPYKRPEVAVEAARRAGVKLLVAGGGRASAAVEASAGPGIELLGSVSDEELRDLYRRCRALVFPGIEDFGLVPVEAQACGTPVIAYNAGGVLDSVIDGVTGTLYEGGAEGLAGAMSRFDPERFDHARIRRHAEQFGPELFRERFAKLVADALDAASTGRRLAAVADVAVADERLRVEEYTSATVEGTPARLVSRLAQRAEGAVLAALDLTALVMAQAVVLAQSASSHADRTAGFGFALIAAMFIALFGGYRPRLQPSGLDDAPMLAKALAAASVALVILVRVAGVASDLLPQVLASYGAIAIARSIAHPIIVALRRKLLGRPSIVVGAGQVGVELHRLLLGHPEYGLHPIGVVDDVAPPPDVTHLGAVSDLSQVVFQHDVRRVIVAFGPHGEQRLVATLRAVRRDVDVYVVPRFFELGLHRAAHHLQTIWGIPVWQVRPSPEGDARWRTKRVFDAVVSGLALIVLSPVCLLIAFAVKRSSPGPVLFRQRRIGQHGREIQLLKFRTMAVNSDADTTWSVKNDARITPVGQWLRRLSLDEIPQLWNVMRGDMSLVGPRPERPMFVDTYVDEVAGYGDRHRIPVGLTGLAQVHGLRGDTSIVERARFDNLYIDHWSLWQDAKILLRTGAAVAQHAFEPARTRPDPTERAKFGLERMRDRSLLLLANALLAVLIATGKVGDALLLAVAVPAALAIRRRPQLGLLVLAALAPFEGLLDVLPHPGLVAGWKEALVIVTLAATFLAPRAARGPAGRRLPPWSLAVAGLFAVSIASAFTVGGTSALYGLKISFFYVLLAWAIWRCPPDERERDRLVTVLFITALIAAIYGLAQQVLGPVRLNQLGYEYNTTIRFSGGYLRSFSTFVQPFGLGFYEMVVMLVCLTVSLDQAKRLRSQLFFLCLPLLFLGMLVSFVRGAWIGFAVGIAYLGIRRHRGLLLAIPLALVVLVALPTGDASRAALSSQSGQQRAVGWSERSRQTLTHPLGNGLGSTGAAAEKAQLLRGVKNPDYYTPDNQYFLVLYEVGVLGLWCLLRLFTAVLRSLRGAEQRLHGPDSSLARGTTAMVVAAAAASLTASYLQIFPMDVLWWALIAVVAATDAEARHHESERSPEPERSREPARS